MTPDISILVVTYRCRDAARACLASIEESTGRGLSEVIVVDNASGDGTPAMVRDEFPAACLIEMEENVGFAAGVNRAAEEARGEYLLLLNPDTLVHEGSVERLVDFARSEPRHGLYGGRTLDPDGSVNPGSCWGRPTLWSLFCFATMLSTVFHRSALLDPESLGGWKRDTVREVGVVTGCLLAVRRDLWTQLGGFDERFFMYGEDTDLSLRAAALGYRPAITPDAVVTHEIGVSSASRPDKFVLVLRSKVTLVRKHWHFPARQLGIALLWAGAGVRALLGSAGVAGRGSAPGLWRELWRERARWLAGFPDAGEEPPSTATRALGRMPADTHHSSSA